MYLVMKGVHFECFHNNTILSIMVLCQGTAVGKMEHSHTDSSVLATQGCFQSPKKMKEAIKKEIPFYFLVRIIQFVFVQCGSDDC